VSKYRIQTVAQLTGLSSALIRAWEARYRLVQPERTAAGYRLYSDDDVAVLLGAQSLVRQGMAPMQISQLPKEQIIAAQRLHLLAPEPASSPAGSTGTVEWDDTRALLPDSTNLVQPLCCAERIDRLINAFSSFDNRAAEELLAVPLRTLPGEQVCRGLLLPLLVELGERWHRREISVAVEHFGSTLVRNKLMAILDEIRPKERRHQVLCACPPGELHEMGLLLFALEAAGQGWDPIYLGANVPVSDLLQTARKLHPSLVALSFVTRPEPSELRRLLGEVTHGLKGVSQLLVGGGGLRGHYEIVRGAGCLMMPESGRLADLLPLLRNPRSPDSAHRPQNSKSAKKFLP
jgi:methanogenic corrinoid protein MtbC1